jgi:hypothetical protein
MTMNSVCSATCCRYINCIYRFFFNIIILQREANTLEVKELIKDDHSVMALLSYLMSVNLHNFVDDPQILYIPQVFRKKKPIWSFN